MAIITNFAKSLIQLTEALPNILHQKFGSRKTFTKSELEALLKNYYAKTVKSSTNRWRIYNLKEKGIIEKIGRGLYGFPQVNKKFEPYITDEAKEIYSAIQQELPYIQLILTDTAWFNEFMTHQVFGTYLIIETEKDAMSAVFNQLESHNQVSYLDPTKEVFDNYIIKADHPVIVRPLVSESPVTKRDNISVSTLEKIIVDTVADPLLYGAQQEEIAEIFREATQKYPVNAVRMKRYARRRNKEDQIEKIMKKTGGE